MASLAMRLAAILAPVLATTLPATLALGAPPPGSAQTVLQKSAQAGTLHAGRVYFSGDTITIPVVAVAPGAPDQTFEIHAQVNPTLVVPPDAKLRFVLANNDAGMPHTLDVTLISPPYARIPVNVPAAVPDDIRSVPGLFAATGSVAARRGRHSSLPLRSTGWFRLAPGTYYYVCAIPGHARHGMYGMLVVRRVPPAATEDMPEMPVQH